jgi:hypothetical protein
VPALLICNGLGDELFFDEQGWLATMPLPARIPDIVAALDTLVDRSHRPPAAQAASAIADAAAVIGATPVADAGADADAAPTNESDVATIAPQPEPRDAGPASPWGIRTIDVVLPTVQVDSDERIPDERIDIVLPVSAAVRLPDSPAEIALSRMLIDARTPMRRGPTMTSDPLTYDRRAVDFARALVALVDELPSTSGAAGVVLSRVMATVGATEGAVLLSDGLEWRVAAGAGLRPLEWRLQLPDRHWVIDTVVRSNTALVVDDTDAVRGRLSPLPLSRADHLLVAPLGRVAALAVVSKPTPFAKLDVDRLQFLPQEVLDRLADSLHVRSLARALDPLRDMP